MCGIAGYISFKGKFSGDKLRAAIQLIKHRGPDAEGLYFSENNRVGLAHRRLSILDLSETANQPMYSADGRYCIVFNGEIYNFNELKLQLSDRGASLRTTSDTEVILELFAQQGSKCFSSFNGMFAFAIYDNINKLLTLCRDHMGIKPLFYYQDENNFIFASELKVIKCLLENKVSINKSAVPFFLHLGFIPQPLTIYNNTYKFPSAHFIQIETDTGSLVNVSENLVPYWSLDKKIVTDPLSDETTAKETLKNLLFDSIRKQLVSDVPIGTFLSGGIDSSIITAIASNIQGEKNIKTFSIAIDDGKYNEAGYAEAVATYLKTDHYEFKVKEKEVLELVDTLIPTYDEPFADSSAFPTMMVSRLARKYVTVALSGDGGDELFQGYGMNRWADRLAKPYIPFVKDSLYMVSKILNSKYQRAGNLFDYPSRQHILTHIFSQEQYYFKETELMQLLVNPLFSFSAINTLPKSVDFLSASSRQSFWDIENYLKDDLLVKVDRASMQYSLESRVPLLDHKLVEFAFNISDKLKINGHVSKYLLKEVLYDFVPKELFDRPKWGFSIPLVKWLKNDLKYLLDQYTSKSVIEKYGFVKYEEVEKIKIRYLSGVDYLYNRLWLIVVLHWWLSETEMNL